MAIRHTRSVKIAISFYTDNGTLGYTSGKYHKDHIMQTDHRMYGHPVAPEDATGKLKEVYDSLEEMLGGIMPHVQIHVTHALEEMKCFTDPMKLTRNHPEVPLLWFAFMRIYVATKENYPYCIALNTAMLRNSGITERQIKAFTEDPTKIPLDKKLTLLLLKAIKSIYDSHHFAQKDFDALYQAGYSDRTIYQIISYSTGFSGIARRLNTYLVKEQA